MKKIYLLFLCFCIAFAVSMDVQQVFAYTQEEKQMAKDWLSAHGYSPDWGGAGQAYQDYLDGKLDLSAYGLPSPGSQTEQAETEAATERQTEAPDKEQKGKKKAKTAEKETDAASVPEADASAKLEGQSQGSSVENPETQQKDASADVQEETSSETKQEKSSSPTLGAQPPSTAEKETETSEISSETTKATEVNKESDNDVLVIPWLWAIIVLLLAAIVGSFLYMRAERKKM